MADEKDYEKGQMLNENDSTEDCMRVKYEEGAPLKRNCRYMSWCICLVVINALLICLLLGLVIRWRVLRLEKLVPVESTICLPCNEIGLDGKELPTDIERNTHSDRTDDKQKAECCGPASVILDRMVSKAITDRQDDFGLGMLPFETSECKITTKEVPSAQLNGISIHNDTQGARDTIHWDNSDMSFLRGGVTYEDGKLSPGQAGYYYIFSQIQFSECESTDKDIVGDDYTDVLEDILPKHFDHFIYRRSSNSEYVKILESSKSACELATSEATITSSIGAVFYLSDSDELFVNTSHPECLVPSKEGNLFGMYMV